MKAGKGEYGEGIKFLGIRIPVLRAQLKEFYSLSVKDILRLLRSKYHEERWFALQLLVIKFQKGDADERKIIYDRYLENIECINSWDLVDGSAPKIAGPYLENKSRRILYRLAKSRSLWKRRIAIMSTFHFIRSNDFDDTFKISKIVLQKRNFLTNITGTCRVPCCAMQ